MKGERTGTCVIKYSAMGCGALTCLRISAVTLLAAMGGACSDEPVSTPGGTCWDGTGGTEGGMIEIGSEAAFSPLDSGDTVTVERGLQGGFHISVHVRMSGLAPGTINLPASQQPKTLVLILDDDGRVLNDFPCPYEIYYVPSDAGDELYELPGPRAVALKRDVIPTIDGQSLTIETHVIDNSGTTASASVDVIASYEQLDAGVGGPDGG